MNDVRARFGTALRELRLRQRLTQEQLAERAGLSYKFIGEIERGSGNPTLETIASLADGLGVAASDLLGGSRRERPSADADFRMSRREVQLVREVAESLGDLMDHVTSPAYKIKRKKSRRS